MTNYNERLDDILSGFAIHSSWYGFDKALGTEGKHTSSSRSESLEAAKQAILALKKKWQDEAELRGIENTMEAWNEKSSSELLQWASEQYNQLNGDK